MIPFLLAVFAITVLGTLLLRSFRPIALLNILGALAVSAASCSIAYNVYNSNSVSFLSNLLYIDSFSIIYILIVALISLIAAIYSLGYLGEELREKTVTLRRIKLFYCLFELFVLSMLLVCLSNNIVLMWIGLEATTLSTAFLIGFDRTKLALEAAWKYIIICSIGIGIGLVGIILVIYSAGGDAGREFLNWTYLLENYKVFDLKTIKLAFAFIFIGIGTKAGLAPMHTWLPDGHSEAPSPISAMMSGILLNLALYVVIRFYIILRHIQGLQGLRYLFIVFGLISLGVAAFSILRQNNYKRLLAFSSIENMGIITLGIGIGGWLGTFGALLHSVIHAFAKTLLFLVSGNILSANGTKRIDKLHGLIKTMPVNSVFLLAGMLVLTGAPPFAAFFSEFDILLEGIRQGFYISTGIYALCLLLVFAGFVSIFSRMIFGLRENTEYKRLEKDSRNLLPLCLTLLLIIGTSVYFGGSLNTILGRAVAIVCQ